MTTVETLTIIVADSAIKYIRANKNGEEEDVKKAYNNLYQDVMAFIKYEETLKRMCEEEKLQWWSSADADLEWQEGLT